jgi:hypothetical protein
LTDCHMFLFTYRTENIFKQLDERSLTEEEERIIQQRVSGAAPPAAPLQPLPCLRQAVT